MGNLFYGDFFFSFLGVGGVGLLFLFVVWFWLCSLVWLVLGFVFLFLLFFIIATDYLIPKEEACGEENEEK